MKLTKREKNMIIVLAGVLVLYGYINFIVYPQAITIKEVKNGIKDYELELQKDSYSEDTLDNLNNKYKKHLKNIDDYSKGYFTSLEQSTLILLLDSFINNTELEISGIEFSEYRIEQLEDNELNAISASIPFNGYYQSLLDFLRQIRENNKKILIKDINILNKGEDLVSGKLVLDFYSIPPSGAKKLSNGIIKDTLSSKFNPFSPFEGYAGNLFDYPDEDTDRQPSYNQDDNINIQPNYNEEAVSIKNIKKVLLEGFEGSDMFFIGNPKDIEGSVVRNSNKKQGNYSVKFEYDFLLQRKSNIANIVLNNSKSAISIQPEYLSISVYSYEKSNHQLGLILKDALGKEYNILLADKIDWTEWSTLKSELPEEITYPATIQRIYAQSTNLESKTNGVFLLDEMEVAYRDILPHSYKKHIDNNPDEYIEYYVKKGDTIFNISKKFYNDYNKRLKIMEYNNIKNPNQIRIGQKLLIPKI